MDFKPNEMLLDEWMKWEVMRIFIFLKWNSKIKISIGNIMEDAVSEKIKSLIK